LNVSLTDKVGWEADDTLYSSITAGVLALMEYLRGVGGGYG
jgi:hypothetical protein